jgi:hypothetical protein
MRALAVLVLLLLSAPAQGILISEYVEGNGNNQALERRPSSSAGTTRSSW